MGSEVDIKKRYQGLKPKLIHLDPKIFEMLDLIAKRKDLKLKKYIEILCKDAAIKEVEFFLKIHQEKS